MKVNNYEDLEKAIVDELDSVGIKTRTQAKRAVDRCSEGAVSAIRDHITFRDNGKYSKAIAIKKTAQDFADVNICYVKPPHYRLTHLLEHGHAKRNGGGRTRAFPHMQYGEQYAQENLPKFMKEELQNGD